MIEQNEADREPEPEPSPRDRTKVLDPKVLLEFLGASAGITAFTALLGGALLWLRFDALGLPADRAVTLLPREMLITVGAHALIGPLVAGLIAVIAIYVLHDRSELVLGVAAFLIAAVAVLMIWEEMSALSGAVALIAGVIAGVLVARLSKSNGKGLLPKGIGRKDRPMVVTLAVLGIGVVAIIARVDGLRVFPELIGVALVVAVGLALIFVSMHGSRNPDRSRKPILWIVFVVYLFAGTVVAVGRTAAEPKIEPVAVLLKDPEAEIAGFYVGESADEFHIAQLRKGSGLLGVSAEPVEAIVSVARDRVTRKALRRPAGLGLADEGREQAETLLENLVAERRALTGAAPEPAKPVATTTPEHAFAPLVSLHADEPSAPMSADEFLKGSRLYWAFRKCPTKNKALSGLLTSTEQWRTLGEGGFKQGARCGRGPSYDSNDHTRPFDKKRAFRDGRPQLIGREGFYVDLVDDKLRRRTLRSKHEGDQRVLKPTPVYFEHHKERASGAKTNVRLTYWFFYPFSFPVGTEEKLGHEGDWERVSVLVHETKPGLWRPLSVRFHAHSGSVDVPWEDLRKAPDQSGQLTHPRAYAARGSHATYRRGGRYLQVLARGSLEILAVQDDARACPECPLWFTWQRLVDAEKQPWYDFGGAWGVAGSAPDFTGPLGPSRAKTVGGKAPSPETTLQQTSDNEALVPAPTTVPEPAAKGPGAAKR